MMMNKFFVLIPIILLFTIQLFSQTKSVTDAETQITSFINSGNFSAVYDQSKYVTKAEVSFDILEPKTPLEKQFKAFEFQITSLFADNGIDQKPVRNTLCINTQSKKFNFASDRNLTILLDGEIINLGEADRSTEVKGRKIKENLCWEIDKEIIKDFGTASKFDFQISNIKESLPNEKLQFFKDFSKLVQVEKN